MSKLTKLQRKLHRQIAAANTTGIEDMKKALKVLAGDAAPDPASLPTRQQRRAAERRARKGGA